jgi:hypothetical protein
MTLRVRGSDVKVGDTFTTKVKIFGPVKSLAQKYKHDYTAWAQRINDAVHVDKAYPIGSYAMVTKTQYTSSGLSHYLRNVGTAARFIVVGHVNGRIVIHTDTPELLWSTSMGSAYRSFDLDYIDRPDKFYPPTKSTIAMAHRHEDDMIFSTIRSTRPTNMGIGVRRWYNLRGLTLPEYGDLEGFRPLWEWALHGEQVTVVWMENPKRYLPKYSNLNHGGYQVWVRSEHGGKPFKLQPEAFVKE